MPIKNKRLLKITGIFLCSMIMFTAACSGQTGTVSEYAITNSESADTDLSENEVTIVMAGDLLMHRFVQESGKRRDGSYNFDRLFENVKPEIESADIAIINQETLLAGSKYGLSGYPCFNAPCEVADAIAAAGFNVVLQATNHTLDKGFDALACCRSYWSENYPQIKIAGTHTCESDADCICVTEINGIKIAVLNFTYGTNGIPCPVGKEWAVEMLDSENVRRDFESARDLADFIIVCPHWGTEYTHTPSEEQRKWCRLFVEYGADLVIGTHPHVIQPLEWEEGCDIDGNHVKIPVYYSLGNFVNSSAVSGNGTSVRMLGGMAKVSISRGKDGNICINEATVIPLVTQLDNGFAGITVYPFGMYTEALAESNRIVRDHDPLFSYEYCESTFIKIFGDSMVS